MDKQIVTLAFCHMSVTVRYVIIFHLLSHLSTLYKDVALLCILSHWGRVTHICVSKLTIIGSDNGLSPDRRQVIIWTNTGLLLIGPLGTNFSEIVIKILTFSFKKMRLKVSSAKRRPFCLGLYVLSSHRTYHCDQYHTCVTTLTCFVPINGKSCTCLLLFFTKWFCKFIL